MVPVNTCKTETLADDTASAESPLEAAGLWALTPGGIEVLGRLTPVFPHAAVFLSQSVAPMWNGTPREVFSRLPEAVEIFFHRYRRHVFVMATGIVVRATAPLLRGKTIDPAVVVVDDTGRFAVSLLSGHIGGANRLAVEIAAALNATPVITTATDANRLPAVDVVAAEKNLSVENPSAIRFINAAVLRKQPIRCFDPMGVLESSPLTPHLIPRAETAPKDSTLPGVIVSDETGAISPKTLVLRPKTLAVGVGCNRGTSFEEIRELLLSLLTRRRLSIKSLRALGTIEVKRNEPGIAALAAALNLPLRFFSKTELGAVKGVVTPSETVKRHVGAGSVCEAAAILTAEGGRLIVPKTKTKNATMAIARIERYCMSSAPDPAIPGT
jgi:cobalt-precorrin 5A hydrolase